jgi:uncharacterized membrane protein (UPF0136 family)
MSRTTGKTAGRAGRVALALLLTLAAAWAQTTTTATTISINVPKNGSIFNIGEAESAAVNTLVALQTGMRVAFTVSVALMIFDVIRALLLEHSGIPGIFKGRIFWIPLSFIAFIGGLWLVAQMSAPVSVVYQLLVGQNCPLYWCP